MATETGREPDAYELKVLGYVRSLLTDPAEAPRQSDAVVHRRVLQRHERDDIRRADSWMFPRMLAQIDMLGCFLYSRERSFNRSLERDHKGDHGSVRPGCRWVPA